MNIDRLGIIVCATTIVMLGGCAMLSRTPDTPTLTERQFASLRMYASAKGKHYFPDPSKHTDDDDEEVEEDWYIRTDAWNADQDVTGVYAPIPVKVDGKWIWLTTREGKQ